MRCAKSPGGARGRGAGGSGRPRWRAAPSRPPIHEKYTTAAPPSRLHLAPTKGPLKNEKKEKKKKKKKKKRDLSGSQEARKGGGVRARPGPWKIDDRPSGPFSLPASDLNFQFPENAA
jgi:hypothetical protein